MFSKRLRSLRKGRNLTQTHMANLLGITRQGYSKYENDDAEPDFKTLVKLATYFEVTTDYLLGKSDNPRLSADQYKEYDEKSEKLLEIFNEVPDSDQKDEILEEAVRYIKYLIETKRED